MIDNNKLICDFMKYEKESLHYKKGIHFFYQIPNPKTKMNEGFWEDQLPFESWDYLIPVIKKCKILCKDEVDKNGVNHKDYFDVIIDSLSTLKSNIVYEKVVKYIKYRNIL